jgi:hypothetical protein
MVDVAEAPEAWTVRPELKRQARMTPKSATRIRPA